MKEPVCISFKNCEEMHPFTHTAIFSRVHMKLDVQRRNKKEHGYEIASNLFLVPSITFRRPFYRISFVDGLTTLSTICKVGIGSNNGEKM